MSRNDTDGFEKLVNVGPPPLWVPVVAGVLALVATAFVTYLVLGAPVPFPKPAKPVPLTRAGLAGEWWMHFGGARYPITLGDRGAYSCRFGAVKYVGLWGVSAGRFWLTESSTPADRGSWKSYVAKMKPGKLEGVIEIGAPGMTFRLERVKAVKVERLKVMPRSDE